ncbi:MAG TPA: hypothetical protein VGZ49_02140 [Xanthobacteraceae bacterium]|jgi:hypothetical protein|nr:hypothetical protein [Xanthobacteraceae bacterium]
MGQRTLRRLAALTFAAASFAAPALARSPTELVFVCRLSSVV